MNDEDGLRLEAKNQYGTVRVFPVGELANAVQVLTNRKSLEPRDIKALAELGLVPAIVANGLPVNVWIEAQAAGIAARKVMA